MSEGQRQRALEALIYHEDVIAHLQREERHAWEWSASGVLTQEVSEIRGAMLRDTYRLEQLGHPLVFEACHTAMARLGIEAPFTLYQANDGSMNASLVYVPGEIHLVLFGPILEKLDQTELLALMGHELAHYRLWSMGEREHYRASRVFDHALSYPDAKPSHRETARLLSLHTELFADRGAAIAAGAPGPAVAVLVKVMTGLTNVDPEAYLRQAQEVEAAGGKSKGLSHPEIYLRARALQLWWEKSPELDQWLDKHLHGPLSLEALDLLGQRKLTQMTRAFLARFMAEIDERSDEMTTQLRAVFPDFGRQEEPQLDLVDIGVDRIDDTTRDYFVALMFDLAMADADATDTLMLAAAKVSAEIGASERLTGALRRDLKWTKARTDKLIAQAAKAA
ncbi:M48 family metalloprotease [Rhizobium ruizarguesonis]|uniref:M48 family metalloprotease n=1 Tax=Rhizobium ruizarguesonis TaxID=2081791 RepID=UPI0013BF2A1D|nr:M48 family metalloprotease [Rhizobium ruizarguesonis]NEJ03333.1 M48 family metalloprotease [Rhizobium ruizarguesonis]NEJ40518.1 M48 family metalloprotease [Rhizobium ruizarguesonis]